jgi:Sec-independent protein translocase protein TatA
MKKNYTLLTFILSILALATFQPVDALTVSPPKLELSGDPGSTIAGVIKLYNEKETEQSFYTSFENFEPSDDSGTPRFIGAESGLATWLTTTGSVTLSPSERIEIPFTLSIPADADAGGYFAAVFFGTQPPQKEGEIVSIGGRLGVLVLLRVNGDIAEDGGVLDYALQEGKKIYDMPPVHFEYRFRNNGGDRVIPRGDIELKNTFGVTRATITANPVEGNVLPGSARKFKTSWKTETVEVNGFFNTVKAQWRHFHFGRYTAQLHLGWGFTNQVATDSLVFFVVPWQLIVVVVVSVVVVWSTLRFVMKRYRAALLRDFQKNQNQQEQGKEKEKEVEKKQEDTQEPQQQEENKV